MSGVQGESEGRPEKERWKRFVWQEGELEITSAPRADSHTAIGMEVPQTDVMVDLNERLVFLQSWWLTSELIRRHPHLSLIETHPAGGTYDCLTVIDQRVPPAESWPDGEVLVYLNRVGTIRVRDHYGFMTFETERAFGDRHGALKRIEEAAGLAAPHPTPASTPFSLALRVIYRFLALNLNEKEQWDVRNLRIDDAGWWPGMPTSLTDLSKFPSALEALRIERRDDLLGDRRYHFWVLIGALPGGQVEPQAVLDTDGYVHLPNGRANLVDVYEKSKRRITPTLMGSLGSLLP